MTNAELHHAVRDGIARGLAIVGLAGIALVHLVDAPGQFAEVPYLGWTYVGLIVACGGLAASLLRRSDRRAWAAAGALAMSVIAGYTLSRTTGLPADSGDIGNWAEPLGLASLFVEGCVVAVSAFALSALVPRERVRTVALAGAAR
jgi:hypothetical protein